MRKFTLNLLSLSLGLALMPLAQAANSPQQKQLLEQVRLGESTQREDLVRQSLYRLELIDPNNPDVIAARFRYLLRQGDTAGAQKELDRLKGIAPGSVPTSRRAIRCCFPPLMAVRRYSRRVCWPRRVTRKRLPPMTSCLTATRLAATGDGILERGGERSGSPQCGH
jgi:hypothetical protein